MQNQQTMQIHIFQIIYQKDHPIEISLNDSMISNFSSLQIYRRLEGCVLNIHIECSKIKNYVTNAYFFLN